MTSKTTVAVKKSNNKRASNTAPANTGFRLKGSEWLTLPLGILILACLYTFASTMQSFNFSLASPSAISLLVGVFSVIYVYKSLKAEPRHPVATVIAYVFSAFLVILGGVLIATSGNECGGNCSTSSALIAWLVVFNPFTAILWSPLAIIGAVLLLTKRSK
jgi:uncharacterized membrane protein YdcZ (DUF606 family)